MAGDTPATAWTHVGRVDDIPARGARVVRTAAGDIAVFRTDDGQIHAIEDKCPHLAGPLSQGIVHGAQVTCPLHNLVIDLATGGALGPDGGCVRVYPVQVSDGDIQLDLAAPPEAEDEDGCSKRAAA